MEKDQEAAKIKELIEIVPDEEEVAIDAIPLAVKSPSIVDWKIHKEGKKTYYQIIRLDEIKASIVNKARRGHEKSAMRGRIVGIKRLLDDLRVTAAQVCVTAAKLNYYCSKIKTAERVSTVRERIKTEERIKIVWRSRLLM
ncbi:copia protein [Tanacetum coccineum]